MKKSKKITNKNNSYRKLSISILIAITIFLTGSVYAATNFGVGPFSSFLPIPSINRVSDFDDPLVSNAVQKKANDAANLAVTKVARLEQEVKADPTPKKVKDLQEAQAEEVVAVNVSALAAKVVVDTNNSNTKTDLQFGSVADTAGVNSTYNALKAATEKKLLQEGVIETVKVIDGSYTKEFVNKFSINTPKMEEIKNQFANKDVKTNAGTCGTNGAPVLEGTWVSSGHPLNADGSKCESGASCPARECMKCGKDGNYEGSQTCSSVLTQGQPVVLPQQAGKVYTGIDMTLSTCFSKVNGTLTQIAIGQSQGDAICAPTGSMIKKSEIPDDVIAKLNDYCKLNKQEWKDGKCQNSAISQESLNSELAKAKIAEAARQKTLVDAAKLSAEQFDKERLSKTYDKNNCGGATFIKANEKCVQVQETGKFAIVPKDFVGNVVSYNVGASAGRPTSFTGQYSDTTYTSESQCKVARRAGESCVDVGITTPQYKIMIDRPFVKLEFGTNSVSTTGSQNSGEVSLISGTSYQECLDNLGTGKTCVLIPGSKTEWIQDSVSNPTIKCNKFLNIGSIQSCEYLNASTQRNNGTNLTPTVVNSSEGSPLTLQNEKGKTSGEVDDPNDCKYTPAVKRERTDKWVCPTEETVKKFTPVSNERPEGQTAYIAPGNKLYNGGSCYGDNGSCLSGYCESKVGFDKCADIPATTPENDSKVQAKLGDIANKMIESGVCTETNVDVGIRVKCNSITSDPIFEYCDQGNGTFDSSGNCVLTSRTLLIQNDIASTTRASHAVGGAAGGALACGLVSILAAPFTGGVSVPAGALICGGMAVAGGAIGYNIP